MPTLADLLRQGSWNDGSADNTRQLVNALRGAAETGMALGSGALAGLAGMPYGIYKGVTSGAYGTPEAPRIAAKEAQQFMERNTYQPRTEQGQEYVQKLGRLFEESKLPPVMPEAAILGAIPKQAYAAQAERAGMAAEKALEPAIMRTMEHGGKPAQLLEDLVQGTKSSLDVWHGSPHGPFGKFDPSKARTGEGNASYGEGAYLAEARGTGESYKNALTSGENYVNGELLDPYKPDHYLAFILNQESGNVGETASFLKDMISMGGSKSIKDTAKEALFLLEKGEKPKVDYIKPSGYLYKVDLPDESIAKMMDWDKPLGKQSDVVKQAIEKTKSMLPPNAIEDLGGDLSLLYGKDVMPEQFLNTWESFGQKAGGETALAKHDVTGIRYLDQGSRGVGEGTSNFVVFPQYQNLLTIKEINDLPVENYKNQLVNALRGQK